MRPKNNRKPMHGQSDTPKVRRAPGTPTKSQLRALAAAELQARVTKWKTLLAVAGSTWPKVHATELSRSQGDINVLAGLVQLHQRVSRQDADSQVKAFYDQHMKLVPMVLPKPVVVAAVVVPAVATTEVVAEPAAAPLESA